MMKVALLRPKMALSGEGNLDRVGVVDVIVKGELETGVEEHLMFLDSKVELRKGPIGRVLELKGKRENRQQKSPELREEES